MEKSVYLGELEQAVLWTVLRLDGAGYGATILEELNARLGRDASAGAVYATLDRLESKGMIASRLADPDAKRGGRRKRFMEVTGAGKSALARLRSEWMGVWEGLEVALGAHEP